MQTMLELSTIIILALLIVGSISILLSLLSKDGISNRLEKQENVEDSKELPSYLLVHPEIGFLGIPLLFLSGCCELLIAAWLMTKGDIPQLLAIGFVVNGIFLVWGTLHLYHEIKTMLVRHV